MKKYPILFTVLLSFVPVYGRIIHVPAMQPTIQSGIIAAANGDTVLVAAGVYFENINFRGKAIMVASHYLLDRDTSAIVNTVIDGSRPAHPDSASVVSFLSGEDTTSVLYGFTLTRGRGTLTQWQYRKDVSEVRAGGGIFCYNAGPYILQNRIIKNRVENEKVVYGGGIYSYAEDSLVHVILDSNRVMYNTLSSAENAWGCGVLVIGLATVRNNRIFYNTSYSGIFASGAVNFWSDAYRGKIILKNNQIRHNRVLGKGNAAGGGVFISDMIDALIINNDISHNEVNSGRNCQGGGVAFVQCDGNVRITGNIISHNWARGNSKTFSRGGGIDITYNSNQSNIIIHGNMITGNRALVGGAFHNYLSRVQFYDNVVEDNADLVWEETRPDMQHQHQDLQHQR